jgi:glutamate-1-semialdehyde aminotransferase
VFLQVLREITEASGTALIFDEVFTGFRAHLGGVQALFGIKADIATYGKVVGGGLPIGVVAGKSDYMDRIDGGMWYYGDHSYPQVEPTFYAGTFCKYPLAMVAARTMLKYLKEQGPTLQQQLNERTSQLVERLNTYFEQNKLSLKVGYHGLSNFHFYLQAEDVPIFWKQTTPFLVELLHYHLIEKGIYIWEGRLFVLSTAHTDEDLEYLFNAVKESVEELQAGGFSFMA